MQKENLIKAEEFCRIHQVEISFIHSLEEHGLLETTVIEQAEYVSVDHLQNLEKLVRMHFDLGINLEGIDAIAHLLEKLQTMQQEISILRNRLNFYEDESEKQ